VLHDELSRCISALLQTLQGVGDERETAAFCDRRKNEGYRNIVRVFFYCDACRRFPPGVWPFYQGSRVKNPIHQPEQRAGLPSFLGVESRDQMSPNRSEKGKPESFVWQNSETDRFVVISFHPISIALCRFHCSPPPPFRSPHSHLRRWRQSCAVLDPGLSRRISVIIQERARRHRLPIPAHNEVIILLSALSPPIVSPPEEVPEMLIGK
jgi:hypothetical protein